MPSSSVLHDQEQVHAGRCHCGKVTFSLRADIVEAVQCNCSICHMKGALWFATDGTNFSILTGEEELGLYQFGTRKAKHYFCRTCGSSPFIRPRLAPKYWAINLRCIEGLRLEGLSIRPFDGKNWDSAAKERRSTRVR